MSPFVRPESVRHADRVLARSVFCLLFALYLATFAGQTDNTDSEFEYQTTSALARRGSFALEPDTPEAAEILRMLEAGETVTVAEAPDGRVYSWHGRGQALVGVPFWYAGRLLSSAFPGIERVHEGTTYYGVPRSEYFPHLMVHARNALWTALIGALLLRAARRLGVPRRTAFVAALAFGVTTFAWGQARSTMNDVPATLCLFAAFVRVLELRERYERFEAPKRRRLVAIGALVGAAFLVRMQVSLALPVLGAVALAVIVRGRRLQAQGYAPHRRAIVRDVAWMLAPALLAFGAYLGWNVAQFGAPLDSGYPLGAGFFNPAFLLSGVRDLFASPGKGLLFLAPGVVLVPWGLRAAWRRGDRVLVGAVLGVALAILGPAAATHGWTGGPNYGLRYVLPAMPFLWLAATLGLQAVSSSRWGRRLAGALLVFGLVANLPAALVDHMTHYDLSTAAVEIEHAETLSQIEPEERAALDVDYALFLETQRRWRYAAPWSMWRIFRHRVAVGDDAFPVREIFFLDSDAVVSPAPAVSRDWGFQHLAWVDLEERLGGDAWPGLSLCLLLLALGVGFGWRGLDAALS